MNQFPMNNNTSNDQAHTIMESPIWIGRLYTFQPTFWITWFVMFGLAGFLSYFKIPIGFGNLFFTSFPLLIALFIDERFIQQFLMPAWERSKHEDKISIRGVPIPKIREWIEWNIIVRKKTLTYIGIIHIVLTIFSTSFNYAQTMILPFIAAIVISTLIKTWIGFKRFGFMSWYFSDIATFKQHHNNS
jgi:hypothetical protein